MEFSLTIVAVFTLSLHQSHAAEESGNIINAPRPNILLLFPDELRYDWGGTVNNPYYNASELPLHTPNIDELARRGTRFTHAIVPTPVCAPSRACLAAGREYDATGQGTNTGSTASDGDFDVAKVPTFYQALRAAGYHTMVTGRDDLTKHTGPGLDGMYNTDALGFSDSVRCAGSVDVTNGEDGEHGRVHDPYGAWLLNHSVTNPALKKKYNATNLFELKKARYNELYSRGRYDSVDWYAIPDPMPDEIYQDDWIGRQALKLLARKPRSAPWFLEVSHQAPHPPMDITASMMATVRHRTFPNPTNCSGGFASLSQQQMMRQNYAAKIERVDYWLGRYIKTIHDSEGSDGLANTVICLCSDHGEMLGDRSGTAKSKPWQSAMSVPIICAGADIASSRVVPQPVPTIDLAATFIDFANGSLPVGMSSRTLRPLMAKGRSKEVASNNLVFSGLGNFRTVTDAVNETHALKFICCNGKCPGGTKTDNAHSVIFYDEVHLFNILHDRFEQPASDLRNKYPNLVAYYASLLPLPHTGAGFAWAGCRLKSPQAPPPLPNIV